MITKRQLQNIRSGTKLYLNFKNLSEFQRNHPTIAALSKNNIKYVYFNHFHMFGSKNCYGSRYDIGIVFKIPKKYSEDLWAQNHFFPVELFDLGLSQKINKLLKY